MIPEEVPELIQGHRGLAFLPRTGAWRIARDGITMRSLAEERLRLVTTLAVRSVSWFSSVVSGCSVDDIEDRSELRSRALARNKRDLTAVTEIPAASATSLLDL